jgi:hypothetical protein
VSVLEEIFYFMVGLVIGKGTEMGNGLGNKITPRFGSKLGVSFKNSLDHYFYKK